jgi:hypothetical protein
MDGEPECGVRSPARCGTGRGPSQSRDGEKAGTGRDRRGFQDLPPRRTPLPDTVAALRWFTNGRTRPRERAHPFSGGRSHVHGEGGWSVRSATAAKARPIWGCVRMIGKRHGPRHHSVPLYRVLTAPRPSMRDELSSRVVQIFSRGLVILLAVGFGRSFPFIDLGRGEWGGRSGHPLSPRLRVEGGRLKVEG